MEKQQTQEKIKEILTTILKESGTERDLSIEVTELEDLFHVDIQSPDDNLLIGYHGFTLNALQHVTNAILYKIDPESRVIIDISGYRKERERKLQELAANAASKAIFINKSVALYPMNSYERRIVHEKISQIEGVTSSSDGEGIERKVIISPNEVHSN